MNATQIRKLEEKIVRLIDPLVEEGYAVMNQISVDTAYDPNETLPLTPCSIGVVSKVCGCLLGAVAFAAYDQDDRFSAYDDRAADALDISLEEAKDLEAGFEGPWSFGLDMDRGLYALGRRMAERYGLP